MRTILNFAISVGVLLGLSYLGWVHVHPVGNGSTWGYLGAAALVCVVYAVLKLIAWTGYLVIWGGSALVGAAGGAVAGSLFRQSEAGATIGAAGPGVIGCLLMPVVLLGAAVASLWGVAWLAPQLLGLNSNLLFTILSVVALGILQIPQVNTNVSSD